MFGGDFLGGFGKLLDPLGIITGGGSEDAMNTLMNPAGALFGAVKGEADKASADHAAKSAEQLKTAQEIVAFLNSNEVQELKKSFCGGDAHGSTVDEAAKDPGNTEYTPPADEKQPDGYADPVQSKQSASTAATGGLSQKELEELAALAEVSVYFDFLDGDPLKGHTHMFDRRNLEACVRGEGNPPESLRKAAQFLLDNPDVLRDLAALSTAGKGFVDAGGIAKYAAMKKAKGAAPESAPSPQPPAGEAHAAPTKRSVAHQRGTPVEEANQAQQAAHAQYGNQIPDHDLYTPPQVVSQSYSASTSFESALSNMTNTLAGLETEMTRLIDTMNTGTPEEARKAEHQFTMLQQKFTMISQQRQAMYTLLSELHKSYNDMAMSSIRNLR